jgi:peptide deformylase
MALREVITVPDETLRRKARPVKDFDSGLQTLIEDMVETMRAAPGVGLAAPQVGVSQRLIVVEFGDEEDGADAQEKPKKLYTLVNPEITRLSKETVIGTEGCLSIPEYVGDVERAEAVTVNAQTRHGQPVTIKAKGWLARIFQHEVDHLDGVLFPDRAEKVYRLEDVEEKPEENEEESRQAA